MGVLLQGRSKLSEAEPYCREAVEKHRRLFGEEHPHTLNAVVNMGCLLQAMNKPAEAIELLNPAEAAARKAFTGAGAKRVGLKLTSLGRSRVALGYELDRFKLAEANLLEARPIPLRTYRETRFPAGSRGPVHRLGQGRTPAKVTPLRPRIGRPQIVGGTPFDCASLSTGLRGICQRGAEEAARAQGVVLIVDGSRTL
jgi:hypothetical protein